MLQTLEVKVVKDLEANIYLTLVEPPVLLGSMAVPFILKRLTNGSFILYLNTMQRSRVSKNFWNDMSQQLCIQVAKEVEKELTAFFQFYECLAECLKVKNRENLQELTEDELNFEGQEDTSLILKVGQDIPSRLLAQRAISCTVRSEHILDNAYDNFCISCHFLSFVSSVHITHLQVCLADHDGLDIESSSIHSPLHTQ